MAVPIDFRPDAPEFLADPFPLYRRLREEDPVHWSPRLKAWILTRYDDVKAVLLDRGISSDRMRPFFAALPGSEAGRIADVVRFLSTWMVFRDPPEHTRLRRLAGKVFNVQSMHAMRPKIEEISAWLIERIGDRAEVDFIADYAGPLPALVIMAMLGVPRERLAMVKALSDDIALFIGSARAGRGKYEIAERATKEMAGFFRALILERAAKPENDLLSQLIQVSEGDDKLSPDELIATCILLLFAGHETTTHHIGNGLLALLKFPDELAALRADPGLAARAVEELLRYDGPAGVQGRVVAEPHERRGRKLARGDRAFLMLSAANRDPEAYADPDRVSLGRDGPPHLAFGFGVHICLGFPLARLEGQIALPAVLARWKKIELAVPEAHLEWLNSTVFRGMTALPLRVGR